MSSKSDPDFQLVYRGFDPTEASMLARLLEAEGIVCRQLGSQHPAAFGVGEYALEQRLEVSEVDYADARALIVAAGAAAEPESDGQAEGSA